MSKRPTLLTLVLISLLPLSIASLPGAASAQARGTLEDPYIGVNVHLGFGGSETYEASNTERSRSLSASFGLAGRYVHPLHAYFALGGSLGLTSWRGSSDDAGSRNLLFDLLVLPTGKYALTRDLELYVSVPLGLALNSLNEVDRLSQFFGPYVQAFAEVDGNTAFGFAIGAMFGMRYQLLESVGLLAELGYMHHSFSHQLTGSIGAAGTTFKGDPVDVDLSFGQFALNIGAYF
jgi:hypothetical protein